MGIIDSFYVALGFKNDPSGLNEFKKQAEGVKDSVLSMGNVITAAVAGYAVKGIAEIGSTFEQNKIVIAGFLSGLGLSSDFNAGLKDADKTIQSIVKAAATLPGEAEEYVQVFKVALPFVQQAIPGGSIEQITDFTNQLTAVGKTFGIAASVIGHEADALLGPQGRASIRFPLFVQLQSFMRKLPGQANLTAESFNRMTQPERLQLMAGAFKLLGPMLDASSKSFDAMWGAAVSAFKQIVRFTTEPLFEGMKKGLDALNATFFDTNGQLTEFGQEVVDIGKMIGYVITRALSFGGGLIAMLFRMRGIGTVLKVLFGVLIPVATMLAFKNLTGKVLSLVFGLQKLKVAMVADMLIMGALAIAVFLIAEDLWSFAHGVDSVTGLLVEKWGPALYIIIGALALLVGGMAAVAVASNVTAIAMALSWIAALAPILLVIAAVALLAKAIFDISRHWNTFKLALKLPLAKIKDMAPGMENEHFADQVRAAMGESWDAEETGIQRAKDLRSGKTAPGVMPTASQYALQYGARGEDVHWQSYEPGRHGSSVPSADEYAKSDYYGGHSAPQFNIQNLEVKANDTDQLNKELQKKYRQTIRNVRGKKQQ